MSFLYNKKTFLNSMKMFFKTLNKRRQYVHYIYTCKFNKMAISWVYLKVDLYRLVIIFIYQNKIFF